MSYPGRTLHKWKKHRNIEKPSIPSNFHITSPYVCVKCGLGKGHLKENWKWHELVYFNSEKILSRGRIPFPCGDEWIGGELLINKDEIVFICEDEFKV